jgi:hypothetical protein
MEMERTISKTVFHNAKANVTQVESADRGVPQGGTASTAAFCVGLAVHVTRELITDFGHVCTITHASAITSLSLVPHMTAWMSSSELSASPVRTGSSSSPKEVRFTVTATTKMMSMKEQNLNIPFIPKEIEE